MAPVGHQFVKYHTVFNIEMEDFACEPQLVTGGHIIKGPAIIMYASVVSREMVHVELMIDTLNNLEMKATDIMNACIEAFGPNRVLSVARIPEIQL